MLPSLHIERFRTFRQLDILGLGHVNLLVGKNNVGKTMVLEAVRLLVSGGSRQLLVELLADRDELYLGMLPDPVAVESRLRHDPRYRVDDARLDVRALFHGRPSLGKGDAPRCIIRSENGYPSVALEWIRLPEQDDAQLALVPDDEGDDSMSSTGLVLEHGGKRSTVPVERLSFQYRRFGAGLRSPGSPLVPAQGLTDVQVARWWDAVSLTDAEERVVACLRIATKIEKIALVENPWKRSRSVMVRVEGERDPVPLRSLGDGIGRTFWIALAMESARETGVLLLDEIENGIHYTVLPDLWRFIFQSARAHGVQVFATSHSWDCIEAFTEVAIDDESRGVLVRLASKGEDIVPTVFSEDELKIVTRDDIEVR